MDPATRQQLAASFAREAGRYAAHRPTYPRAAVKWMVAGQRRDVLDLGAGAGALTAVALTAGHRVVAADPSAAMLRELTASSPAAAAVQSVAEALPFESASFDVVTVATAFHWFDPDRALPEIARVLRADGRLSLTWTTRDERTPWVRRLGQLLRSVQPAGLTGDWATGSVAGVERSGLFQPPEYAEFELTQRIDRRGLLGLVASRSYVMALDDRARERLLANVSELYDEAAASGSAERAAQPMSLPYLAQCWRAALAVAPRPPWLGDRDRG